MERKKICPIRALSPDMLGDCIREECAWYVEGKCALTLLAQALTAIARGTVARAIADKVMGR